MKELIEEGESAFQRDKVIIIEEDFPVLLKTTVLRFRKPSESQA